MIRKVSERTAAKTGIGHTLSVGQDAYLDRNISLGLFDACNGNKYFITQDNNVKIAVALIHRHLSPFTCQPLGQQPLEYGQWWGSCRLRLYNEVPHHRKFRPGNIGFIDNVACMDCRSATGGTYGIAMGTVSDDRYDSRDFDGWALEPTDVNYPFFERIRRRKSNGTPERGVLELGLNQSF